LIVFFFINTEKHASRIEQAKAEYKKAMEIRQKKAGDEHPFVAMSYQNYGHVSLAEGK
jgi:hypothetical protein